MLVLDRVGKTYPNGVHALGGVSFEVELGEILAVIGGSGCGKSTLLRAIAGLDPPSEGAVVLDGERIGAPHAKIGIIFQEPRRLEDDAHLCLRPAGPFANQDHRAFAWRIESGDGAQ